jgi:hypothetical protein
LEPKVSNFALIRSHLKKLKQTDFNPFSISSGQLRLGKEFVSVMKKMIIDKFGAMALNDTEKQSTAYVIRYSLFAIRYSLFALFLFRTNTCLILSIENFHTNKFTSHVCVVH